MKLLLVFYRIILTVLYFLKYKINLIGVIFNHKTSFEGYNIIGKGDVLLTACDNLSFTQNETYLQYLKQAFKSL